MLSRLAAVFLLLFSVAASAQPYSQQQLDSIIDFYISSNGQNAITGQVLRNTLAPITQSIFQGVPASTLPLGSVTVIGGTNGDLLGIGTGANVGELVDVGILASTLTGGPFLPLAGGTMSGPLAMGGNAITGIGGLAVTPAASSLNNGINIAQSTGAASSASNVLLNQITITDAAAISGGNGLTGLQIIDNAGGASLTGNRSVFTNWFQLGATTGNAQGAYASGTDIAVSTVNDNGTNGTPAGALFGRAIGAYLYNGATHWLNLSGMEVGIEAATGSSLKFKFGVNVVPFPNDAVHATNLEAGYGLSANSGAVGLNWGILFHGANGQTPLASTGVIFGLAGTDTVTTGIDFTSWTITGNAWQSTGASVSGAGGYTGTGYIATAVAPTVSANQIGYGSTVTANTSCGTLSGSAGCIVVNIGGTAHYVPYY